MKMKKIAVAVSLACAGFALSPVVTLAGFPDAGVDNVPSLAKFKVTFTKEFAFYLRDDKGAPFCQGYEKPVDCPASAREFSSPTLYEPDTKVGRSAPHRDGDLTDEEWGAEICQEGSLDSCTTFSDDKVPDAFFQWKEDGYQEDGNPYDEGPTGREEVHTRVISFKLTPLDQNDQSANAVRAGDQSACQPSSLGEVESLDGDGFPAESFFHMYVDVDVDMNNDGTPEMVLFNKPGIQNTILKGDPLVIESTGLKDFPPKVIYSHTGRTADKVAPKLYVRGKDCKTDENYPGYIGWIRIATHGIDFGPPPAEDAIKRAPREGATAEQCQIGENDLECFDRHFKSLPMAPVPEEEDGPFPPDPEVVDLDFFRAVASSDGNISLIWETDSEINNAGFLIWKGKKIKGDEDVKVEYTLPNGTPLTDVKQLTAQLIPTQGVEFPYEYVDKSGTVSGNTYYYAIGDVDFKGTVVTIHLDKIVLVTVE